jgi:hypothetical protein
MEDVLDETLDEIEHMEGGLSSPETGQLIAWPLPVKLAAGDNCP